MSEKAVSIGAYSSPPESIQYWGLCRRSLGSSEVTSVLTKGVGGVIGATFAVEPDPFKAASLMIDHIDEKRRGLEL
jgi:carbon-monoxide dehydrogenase catalytic subunit